LDPSKHRNETEKEGKVEDEKGMDLKEEDGH
jgi:hypothetical protein